MRNLDRDKSLIGWVNYKGNEDVMVDDLYTSEKVVTYYPLKKMKAHVSGAKGSSNIEVFGTDIAYDKTVLMTPFDFHKTGLDKKDHITENTVFFIDKKPAFSEDNTPLYDYEVVRIAETKNQVVIALRKV